MALGSVHNVYPNGRPSGLPDDIVSQLVQAKQKQKLTPIEQDIKEAQQRKDNYTALNEQLRNLFMTADKIDSSSEFEVHSASSTNTDAATATAESGAEPGSYNLDVTQLAQAQHKLVGEADGGTTGVTQGVTDPDDETQIADTTFQFDHLGNTHTYDTVDNDGNQKSLNDLAETINNDDEAGVLAQTIEVSDGQYALSLKSQTTGTGNNEITNISGDIYKGGNTGLDINEVQQAKDASFNLDGVDYTRTSNEISDAIPGVTLNLQSDQSTIIDVSLDSEGITQNVQNMVNAFNNYDKFMDENATYDKEEKQAGPLLGDSLARTTDNKVTNILGDRLTEDSEEELSDNKYQYLSRVGINKQDDGSLNFNPTEFQEALQNNPSDVKNLFVGDKGIAGRLKSYLQEQTSAITGTIPRTIQSVEDNVSDLKEDYSEAQQDINRYQTRITEKYSRLEEKILEYQSQEKQLSRAIDTWDTSSD